MTSVLRDRALTLLLVTLSALPAPARAQDPCPTAAGPDAEAGWAAYLDDDMEAARRDMGPDAVLRPAGGAAGPRLVVPDRVDHRRPAARRIGHDVGHRRGALVEEARDLGLGGGVLGGQVDGFPLLRLPSILGQPSDYARAQGNC